MFKSINNGVRDVFCRLKNKMVSDGTEMREKDAEREGQRKTNSEEE